MNEPTPRGIEKYPPTGIYDEFWACTCPNDCRDDCEGTCGCKACRHAYSDAIEWD